MLRASVILLALLVGCTADGPQQRRLLLDWPVGGNLLPNISEISQRLNVVEEGGVAPEIPIPKQYMVRMDDSITPDDLLLAAKRIGRMLNLDVLAVFGQGGKGFVVRASVAKDVLEADSLASQIEKLDRRVLRVYPDTLQRVDQQTANGDVMASAKRIKAESLYTAMGKKLEGAIPRRAGVAIAVLDTGADLKHPALVSARAGRNCLTDDPAMINNVTDGHSHGTHVTGTIAAIAPSSTTGVTGIAPGTTVYAVKVMSDQGYGSESSIVCGLNWVLANYQALNIRVVSMSIGGTMGFDLEGCDATAYRQAICDLAAAGVAVVAATGNTGVDLSFRRPGGFPEVLAVGAVSTTGAAITDGDSWMTWSNWGTGYNRGRMLTAPGVAIFSTMPGGGYGSKSGTSMACPHVSALMARCFGIYYRCTARGPDKFAPGPCAGLTGLQARSKMIALASYEFAMMEDDRVKGIPYSQEGDRRWHGYLGTASMMTYPTATC